jgi:hypothetical protein
VSFPVNTASTPGASAAAFVLIERMFAGDVRTAHDRRVMDAMDMNVFHVCGGSSDEPGIQDRLFYLSAVTLLADPGQSEFPSQGTGDRCQ